MNKAQSTTLQCYVLPSNNAHQSMLVQNCKSIQTAWTCFRNEIVEF